MVDFGRIGLGIATGGLSELGGARPLLDKAGGDGYLHNLLFGGDATKSIDTQPRQYNYATGQLQQMAAEAPYRQAPRIGGTQLDATNMNQSRQGVLDTTGRLGAIASGTQQGAGEMAVNAQVGRANAAQMAAARASRGANAALAYRNAMRNQADIGLAGAGQAGAARMQDQAAANQQLGSLFGNLYGQDASVAAQNAQLGQAAQLANQQAQLQQTGMNDAARIQAIGQMLGWDQATINAQLARAQVAANDKGILPGLIQGAGQAAAAYATGGLSAAGGMGGGGGGLPAPGQLGSMYPHGDYGGGPITSPGQMMSDERAKKDFRDGRGAADAAAAAIQPVIYAYHDPVNGPGPQLGVTAQNLERAGLGHTVVNTPAGKAVDGAKLAGANTAMIASLRDQMAQMRAEMARRDELLRAAGYGRPPEPPPPPMPTTQADAIRAQYEAQVRRPPVPLLPPGWVPDRVHGIPAPAIPSGGYGSYSGAGIEDMGGQ